MTPKKSQSIVDFAISLIAIAALAVGIVRIWIWFNANYAKRQVGYQQSRLLAAGQNRPITASDYNQPTGIGANDTYRAQGFQPIDLTEDWVFKGKVSGRVGGGPVPYISADLSCKDQVALLVSAYTEQIVSICGSDEDCSSCPADCSSTAASTSSTTTGTGTGSGRRRSIGTNSLTGTTSSNTTGGRRTGSSSTTSSGDSTTTTGRRRSIGTNSISGTTSSSTTGGRRSTGSTSSSSTTGGRRSTGATSSSTTSSSYETDCGQACSLRASAQTMRDTAGELKKGITGLFGGKKSAKELENSAKNVESEAKDLEDVTNNVITKVNALSNCCSQATAAGRQQCIDKYQKEIAEEWAKLSGDLTGPGGGSTTACPAGQSYICYTNDTAGQFCAEGDANCVCKCRSGSVEGCSYNCTNSSTGANCNMGDANCSCVWTCPPGTCDGTEEGNKCNTSAGYSPVLLTDGSCMCLNMSQFIPSW